MVVVLGRAQGQAAREAVAVATSNERVVEEPLYAESINDCARRAFQSALSL